MARLGSRERAQLPDSAFAYIDPQGNRRLPINDAAHVRNALARFSQVAFEDEAARDRARLRLLRAAQRHGIVPIGFISAQLQPQRRFPTGTVTFLMTDIERSTELLAHLRDGYAGVLADVRRRLRRAVRAAGGREVDSRADEFFAVFVRAAAALDAAVAIQGDLPDGVRVRIGVHRGRPTLTDTGYVGLAVHTAARVCFAAHGGQVLLSGAVLAELPDPTGLQALGSWRFQGLPEPVELHQLGLERSFPPPRAAALAG